MKKILASFWFRTSLSCLLILLLPLAVYLGALWDTWGCFPHLDTRGWMKRAYAELPYWILRWPARDYLAAVILTCLTVGELWLKSRGKRRVAYYAIMFWLAFTLQEKCSDYTFWTHPAQLSLDLIPATPEELRQYWGLWALCLLLLVVEYIYSRRKR